MAVVLGAGCVRLASAPDPQRVVMRINGEAITQADLDRAAAPFIDEARRRFPPAEVRRLMPRILEEARERLITERVVEQAVARAGLAPDATQIDAEVQAADRYLRMQGSTLADYMQREGMTSETLRAEVARRLARRMFYDRELGIVPPSEDACRAEFDAHPERYTMPAAALIRQLFVPYGGVIVDERERRASLATAERLRARWLAGEPLERVQPERGATTGVGGERLPGTGEAAWITYASPVPNEIIEAAFGQPVGTIGPLIETALGYHAVLVLERREARPMTFDEARGLIVERLMEERRRQAVPALIERLRAAARIETP